MRTVVDVGPPERTTISARAARRDGEIDGHGTADLPDVDVVGRVHRRREYSWSAPDEEVMAALTADLAEVGTYLYGRRTYETMFVLGVRGLSSAEVEPTRGVFGTNNGRGPGSAGQHRAGQGRLRTA